MVSELFPGQVAFMHLSVDQMRVLGSVIRSEVFYMFRGKEPRSVAEIATGLGKSAQTIHYHTNALLEAGLLLAVGERKVHARTEKLYVHKAIGTFSKAPADVDDEYRAEVIAGFYAVCRTMGREMDEAYKVIGLEGEYGKLVAYQQNTIRVSLEHAAEIRERMHELRRALVEYDDPEGEYRVRTSVFMAPSIETSRAELKKLKGK